jgi:dipeptidyl aminopeptidase/acylaminoacyl peptidase
MRVAGVVCAVAVCAGSGSGSAGSVLTSDGLVAYSHRGADDASVIWLVPDDGSSTTNRPRLGRGQSFFPHWSSDGRRLLFTGPTGTYVAEIESGGAFIPTFLRPKRITHLFADSGIDWSPDETTLVLATDLRNQRCSDLYTVRAGRSRPIQRLTATAACENHPAWSPDGRAIAYESEGLRTTDVIVADLAGRIRRVIGQGTYPAWSPDGGSLAFLSANEIVVVDVGSRNVERVLRPESPLNDVENGLTWSPEAGRLVYGFLDPEETFPLTHLAAIDTDGTNSMRLTSADTRPDASPDYRPACTSYGANYGNLMLGTAHDDVICALRGNDRIRADGGDDVVYGGDGADVLVGGLGADWLFGAAGDDRIYARDGVADLVDGGPGVDSAVVDAADRVSGVERVDGG